MNLKYLIIFLTPLTFSGLYTQNTLGYDWAKSVGSANFDISEGHAVAPDGGSYLIGGFTGILMSNPEDASYKLVSKGLNDVYQLVLKRTSVVYPFQLTDREGVKTICEI